MRARTTCVVVFVVGAALVAAAASNDPPATSRAHSLEDATEAQAKSFGDTFPWQQEGPLDFIGFLKRRADKPALESLFYSVHGRHVGWLRDTDVSDLIALVDSKERCPHIVMTRSSYLPTDPSFVGQEALFLIEGYRRGQYPPGLHSSGFYEKKDEILAWWRARPEARK